MKFKIVFFLAILSIIFFSGCDSKESQNENNDSSKQEKKVEIEQRKSFILQTTDNKTIEAKITDEGLNFSGYENKVILLNFFATWCPPCKAEIPHLNSLKDKYKDKIEILAILLEENKDNAELDKFIKENNIKYPISNTTENYMLADGIGGVKSIPTMFLYSKSGKLLEKYVGIVPEEMLESDIEKGFEK